jgi:hypothetical protein
LFFTFEHLFLLNQLLALSMELFYSTGRVLDGKPACFEGVLPTLEPAFYVTQRQFDRIRSAEGCRWEFPAS